MKFLPFILSSCIYLASCHQKQVNTDRYQNLDTTLIINKSYYQNGLIKREIPYKDSLIQGYQKDFFSNGSLKSVTHYNNGIKDGIEKFFYNSGKVAKDYSLFLGKYFGSQSDYNEAGELMLFRYINLDGDLIFKYTPVGIGSFESQGNPVYIAYNKEEINRADSLEAIYNFGVPQHFSYRLFYQVDNNELSEISDRVDTMYYSFRCIIHQNFIKSGPHKVVFILNETSTAFSKSISDTSEIDVKVL